MFLLLLLLHRLMLIISPSQKKKKLAKLPFCFIKNVHENSAKPISFFLSPGNFREMGFFFVFRWNFSQIFQQNSCEISHFFHEFDSENPTKFDFFSVTYQRPCVMNSLHHKSSWSGCLFLSLSPTFFPPQTSIMSSLDQSYFKKVKVWITLYIRSIKERAKCPAI